MKFSAIFLLVALCVVANAQEQEVIRTNTELVQTAITVLDKKGHFVEGLQRDQFQLVVDGKPRQVAFFERVAAMQTQRPHQRQPPPPRRRESRAAQSSSSSTIYTSHPTA
jgi:hypothetical protein